MNLKCIISTRIIHACAGQTLALKICARSCKRRQHAWDLLFSLSPLPRPPPPPFNLLRRIIVVFRTCHFAHVVCPQQVITEYLKTPKQRHVHHNDCTGPVQTYSDILYGIREFVVVLLRMNPMKMAAESATWRKRFPEWKVLRTLVCHSCVEDENETLIFENFDDTVSQHWKCFNPTECLKYFWFLLSS